MTDNEHQNMPKSADEYIAAVRALQPKSDKEQQNMPNDADAYIASVKAANLKFLLQNRAVLNALKQLPKYQGGGILIERLKKLFGKNTTLELGEIVETSPGTFATWRTRGTTPFELLIRIHLFTGIPLQKMLFDIDDSVGESLASNSKIVHIAEIETKTTLPAFSLKNGTLTDMEKEEQVANITSYDAQNLIVLMPEQYVIDRSVTKVTEFGDYLYEQNGTTLLGKMALHPDGAYLHVAESQFKLEDAKYKILGRRVLATPS